MNAEAGWIALIVVLLITKLLQCVGIFFNEDKMLKIFWWMRLTTNLIAVACEAIIVVLFALFGAITPALVYACAVIELIVSIGMIPCDSMFVTQ